MIGARSKDMRNEQIQIQYCENGHEFIANVVAPSPNPQARQPLSAAKTNPTTGGAFNSISEYRNSCQDCKDEANPKHNPYMPFQGVSSPSTSINESKPSTTCGLNVMYVPTPESSRDDHTNSGHNAVTSDSPTSRPSTSLTGARAANPYSQDRGARPKHR